MNIFELEIWDDEGDLCTFYSVKNDGEDDNETDKFFLKFENKEVYKDSLQELLSFILLSIGNDHGAKDELFNRYEHEVSGLPSKGRISLGEFTYHYPQFPLRLYALKITEGIVILFSGGVKDGPTNQTSSLSVKWIEACQYAKRILEAIKDEEIVIDEINRILLNANGESDIIL